LFSCSAVFLGLNGPKKVKERNALLYQPTILNYEKLIVSKFLFAYGKVMTKQTLKSKTFVKVFLHFHLHHSFLSSFVDFLDE